MNNIKLKIGDTFINSQNNLITIRNIFSSGTRVGLQSETGTAWNSDYSEVIYRIKNGTYTNYKSVDNKSLKYNELIKGNLYRFETKDGLVVIGNFKEKGYIGSNKKWKNSTCIIPNEDFHHIIRECTQEEREWFKYCKRNEIYISFEDFKRLQHPLTPDDCIDPYDTSKFKVGDLVTFEPLTNKYIPSDDFIGKIYDLNMNHHGPMIEIIQGSFYSKNNKRNNKNRIKGYKSGYLPHKDCKFKLITNNKVNNEKKGIITTDKGSKRRANAISYSPTRRIASASRLIGNAKEGRRIEAKIRGFKISKRLVAA